MTMSHCLFFTWYFQFLWERYNDGHMQPEMKQNRKVTKILRADQDKKKKVPITCSCDAITTV